MAGRGGGILHELVVHPVKSILGFIFVLTLALTLMLPPKDAIATVGVVAVTVYRAGGVVVGSIPPGIAAFKQGFVAMSQYSPKDSGWGKFGSEPTKKPTAKSTPG